MSRSIETVLLVGSSVDGKVTVKRDGNSKEFSKLLTSEMAKPVKNLRCWADAILVSRKTIENDNPSLSSNENKNLVRIVIDRNLVLGEKYNIFDNSHKTFVVTQANRSLRKQKKSDSFQYIYISKRQNFFETLKKALVKIGIKKVLVEGGGNFNSLLLKHKFIDKLCIAYFPFIVGGTETPTVVDGGGIENIESAYRLELESVEIFAHNMVFLKYQINYQVDPLVCGAEEIKEYKKTNKLTPINRLEVLKRKPYFLDREILAYQINMTEKEIFNIFSGGKKYTIITGFGITGPMHLGGKVIIDEISWLVKYRHDLHIFLSKSDAISKDEVEQLSENNKIISNSILTRLSNTSVQLYENYTNFGKPLFTKLQKMVNDDDFKEIFGHACVSSRYALIDMAVSICLLGKRAKAIVLLGVDEIKNALFIQKCTQKLGLESPGFLFNNIIYGYDGNKMGKSRPLYSLRLDTNSEAEINKAMKFSRNDMLCSKCPLYSIHYFSKNGILNHKDCKSCQNSLKTVIENNFKEWNNV